MYTFRFGEVLRYSDLLVDGLIRSIALSALTIALGFVVGTMGALVALYGPRWAVRLVGAYVQSIRNTPFLAQLFFLFFGLSSAGLRLSPWSAAILALTINFGAYATEIMRAGITSVPHGQIEAAESLGLTRWQIFSNVISFQAIRNVYPSLISQAVILFLGSSVVSAIAVPELFHAGSFIESRTFRSLEIYAVISLIYLSLVAVFRGIASLIWIGVFARRA